MSDQNLSLVHDLAQSWWWCDSFNKLDTQVRKDIYFWTIEVIIQLLQRDQQGEALGGAQFLRKYLVEAAAEKLFYRKRRSFDVAQSCCFQRRTVIRYDLQRSTIGH